MIEIQFLQENHRQGLFDLVEQVNKKLVGMYSESNELVEEWLSTLKKGIWEVYVAILPLEEIKKEEERYRRKLFPWKKMPKIDNGIVGLVTLFGDCEEDEDLQEGEFELGITVNEAFQKRGIGKELMTFIVKRGKELNYKSATLWTRIDNFPMQKLALKLGFVLGQKRRKHGHTWINFKLYFD